MKARGPGRNIIRFRLPDHGRVRALFASVRQDVIPAGRISSSAGILAVQHIARLEREDPHKLAALVTIMRAQCERSADGEQP